MNIIKSKKFEVIIWNKANPIPTVNNKYLSDKEYCLYFKDSGVLLNGSVETKKQYKQALLMLKINRNINTQQSSHYK